MHDFAADKFGTKVAVPLRFTYLLECSIIIGIKSDYVVIKGRIMMNIKPSAAIRKNYNEISELCRRTKEPVYLTKNGEGDLAVMDLETVVRRESMLKLRETLLRSEADIQNGRVHTVEETATAMRRVIVEVVDGK